MSTIVYFFLMLGTLWCPPVSLIFLILCVLSAISKENMEGDGPVKLRPRPRR